MSWLQGQVGTSGALTAESASLATTAQARTEALQTLTQFGAPPQALAALIAAGEEDSTEQLARRVIALASAGLNADAVVASLRNRQNVDGGFGDASAHRSQALDTAWSLIAFRTARYSDSAAIGNAVRFLSAALKSDGGLATPAQSSHAYVTSYGLLALALYRDEYAVSTAVGRTQAWLQDAQDNAASDNVLNAVAILALSRVTSDGARLVAAANRLRLGQSANGSWNNDPYVTSLAVRALSAFDTLPALPTTGSLSGKVRNAQTLEAIAGATVSHGAGSVATGGTGGFELASLAPGPYALTISKAGFQPLIVNVTVSAGNAINLGNISLNPAPDVAMVRGKVADGATGLALGNAQVAVMRNASVIASATTAADGAYQIGDIAPGAATVTVSIAGYHDAQGSVNLVAGTIYVFSPALYPESQPAPQDATLKGTVTDAATGAGISAATVSVSGHSTQTGASGSFTLAGLDAGPMTLSISAPGYVAASLSGSLSVGVNQAGNISLNAAATQVDISGTITSEADGSAIAGALVSVRGTSLFATTDGAGGYQIDGISTREFIVDVEAAGYTGSSAQVSLSDYGRQVVNLALAKNASAGINLSINTNLAVYEPYVDIELHAHASNTGESAKALHFFCQILDAQRNVIEERVLSPFGQLTPLPFTYPVPAHGSLDVVGNAHNQNSPPGQYTVILKATNEGNVVVAEASTSFQVLPRQAIGGDVMLDPPLAQSGAITPISIKAALANRGNLDLPAGALNLQVVLDAVDPGAQTLRPAEVRVVAQGAPLSSPGTVAYDANGVLYVANTNDNKILKYNADGSSTVFATLTGTFQSADMLFDPAGNLVVLQNGSSIRKITPSGTVTTIPTGFLSARGLDMDSAGNFYVTGAVSGNLQQLARISPSGVRTVLLQGGMANPIAAVYGTDGLLYVTSYSDNAISRIDAQGGVSTIIATGLNRPQGIIRDAGGNFIVANSGANNLLKITPAGVISVLATGLNNPYFLAQDPAGNYMVVNAGNNSIVKVSPAGVVTPFLVGVSNAPYGIDYDAAGNLYIVNNGNGTLTKLTPAGQVSTVSTSIGTLALGVKAAPDGSVYVTNGFSGLISRITGSTTSTFATGLVWPHSIAIGGGGEMVVTEMNGDRISKIASNGARSTLVENPLESSTGITVDGQGNRFVANNGFISVYPADGSAARRLASVTAVSIAGAVQGGVYYLNTGGKIVSFLAMDGTTSQVTVSTPTLKQLLTNTAGDLFGVESSTPGRIYKLNASNQFALFATATAVLGKVTSSANGNLYAVVGANTLSRINSAGAFSTVVTLSSVTDLAAASDGTLFAATSATGVVRKISTVGVVTTLFSTNTINGIAINAADGLELVDSQRRLATYTGAGQVLTEFYGFDGPRGVTWAGDRFIFVDQYRDRLLSVSLSGNVSLYASIPASIERIAWDGSRVIAVGTGEIYAVPAGGVATQIAAFPGVTTQLYGVAIRQDGAITVASRTDSRIATFNGAGEIVASYASLSSPIGIAVDGTGQVFVANNGLDTIVKVSADGSRSEPFATIDSPRGLLFDTDGSLLAVGIEGSTGKLYRINSSGSATALGSFPDFSVYGIAAGGDGYRVVNSDGFIYKVGPSGVTEFAQGISGADSVALWNDVPYVVAGSTGNIVRYQNGSVFPFASGMASPSEIASLADGSFAVASSTGNVYLVSPTGVVENQSLNTFVSSTLIRDVARAPSGKFAVMSVTPPAVYVGTPAQPLPTIPAGTVVHTAASSHPAIAQGLDLSTVDFGQWVPQVAGDYSVRVSSASGYSGSLINTIHVGPNAVAQVNADRSVVPPGDVPVSLQVKVSGADFASIAKVNVAGLQVAANAPTPSMMGADADGNIYWGNGAAITRISTGNVSTVLYSTTNGNIVSYGALPVDSSGNLYFGHKLHQLMRLTPAGQVSVVTTFASTYTVRSLAITKTDDIIVGTSEGVLFKVSPQGVQSVIPSPTFRSLYAITIDGAQNLYVLDSSNSLTKIGMDGTASVMLAEADFEYEGMPIAGDCADNIFLAPYTWGKVGQAGEERTLVEMFGKSRSIAQVLSGAAVPAQLGDMDFVVFDHFHNNLLIWSDAGGNPIYKLPLACGAITADFHIKLPAGQPGTGFSVAPTTTMTGADGATEYVWNLPEVSNLGRDISFDTVIGGLKIGDTRKVASEASIVFKNSFSPNDVTVPVALPSLVSEGDVDVDIALDQLSYLPMTEVLADVGMSNRSGFDISGTVLVQLRDTGGAVVAQLLEQGVSIPALGHVTVRPPFNTGSYAAAGYTMTASFTDDADALHDSTEKQFHIGSFDAPSTGVTAKLSTDKAQYGSYEPVRLDARVRGTAVNAIQRDLLATFTVTGPSGATVQTGYVQIAELAPGAALKLAYTWQPSGVPLGDYRATVSIGDADGNEVASAETAFKIFENVDAAVTGSVTAQFPVVTQGQTQVCTDRVLNASARAVTGLQIRRVAAIPVDGVTLSSDSRSIDLPAQDAVELTRNVATAAIEGGDATCALEAFIGGQWKSLAFAAFKVTPEPASAALSVAPDHAVYDIDAQAQITAGVQSLMQYRTVRGAILYIEVTSPSGAVVLSADLPLDDLPPGQARALTQAHAFSNAPEGDYAIRAMLSDALGQTIASAQSSYRVRKSLARALTGAVAVQAESVEQGVDQICTDRLSNGSVYAVAGIHSRHVLSRSEPAELLQTTEFDADIPANALYEQQQTLLTGVLGAGDYVCALEYQADNAWLPLAATPFEVTPEAAHVSADLVLDRAVYDVGSTLTASTTVTSQMHYRSIGGAQYALEVRNSAGTVVFADAAPLQVLDPQAALHPQSITAVNLPEGAYLARAVIAGADGAQLALDEAAFNVRRSIATALTGSVSVSSASVQQGAPLTCSDTVSNASIYALADVPLRRSVLRASNSQVITTESLTVGINAASSLNLAVRNVATASLATGAYRCVLEADTGGAWMTLGAADFSVDLEPLHVALDLTLDKASYDIADQVLRKTHIQSQTQIRKLENGKLRLDVTGPAGSVVHSIDIALSVLQPGAMLDVESIYGYSDAAEGHYTVKATLLDGAGAALQSDEAQYDVRKSVAQAITGSVAVTRPVLIQGESQTCTDKLLNSSRYAVNGLQVRQVLERIDLPQTVSTTPLTLNVPANSENTQLRIFGSSSLAVGSYACRLDALIGGQWTALGSAGFLVNAPASTVRIDASLAVGSKGRVLVVLDEAPGNGSAASPGEPSLADQRVFIETLLRDAGWSATIVTSATDFATEMHSGEYTVYAIMSESIKFDKQTQEELREAVYRGDGMFEAGSHDQRNSGYDDALGVKYKGNWPSASGIELLGSGVMQPGYAPLQTGKKALRADLAGAVRIGRYLGVSGNGASDAAVTQYPYGGGRSIYFGYDLLAEAAKAGATSVHASAILQGLELVQPAYASAYPAQVVPVRLTLQNRGSGVQGRALLTLPAGAQPVDLGGATVDSSGKLVWNYLLAADQASTFTAWVRLPNAAGAYAFNAQVQSGSGSSYVDRASASLSVSVVARQGLAEARTLAASSNSYKKVKTALDSANTAIGQGKYADAQQALLDAANECIKIGSSANTLRQMVDQAMWVNGQKL